MATFDLGRVTPLYKGDYSASASYELNDVVLYNGNLYWHVQATATVGILPTDTTVWKLAFADEGVRAEIRGYADNAHESADSALASKTAAAQSASQASASASQAALSAQTAQTAETGAAASAQTASTKASEASTSAQSAASSAQTATDKATLASQKAAAASESASLATAKASAAATSETNAVTAAQTATTKASEAAASATSAQEYDESAQQSAVNAQTAQGLAEQAQTAAETAQGLAEDARDLAQQYAESIDPEHIYSAYPTDTASGAVASFPDGADDIPLKSLVVNIDPVQSGSGDPSPDNVRPISGWSEVNVQRTGKNLFDEANATIYKRYFQVVTGGYSWAPGTDSSSYAFKCLPNTTYTLKPNNPNVTIFRVATINVSIEESENATLNQVSTTEIPRTITTDADATYIVIQTNNSIVSAKATQLQIELGESATEFEPYQQIQSLNITLGQTVYGGKLDVTKGELTVDSAMADLGTLNWDYYQNGLFYTATLETVAKIGGVCVSDIYVDRIFPISAPINGYMCMAQNGSKSVFRAVNTAYSDATAFKTAMNGHQLVYELATPLTITLTPHEVTALLGSNNIWADTGDSTVEYRADPTLYIQRLTEPDADMVADSNITSGSYFMVGNTLYKATANIASGATISPNVNCTRKSLSEALNELNS